MTLLDIFLIGVGLSMDAFAVSICKGLSMRRLSRRNMIITGLYFGGFQFLMPLIGYFMGFRFASAVHKYANGISFILLFLIGINMIRESFHEEEDVNDRFDMMTMIPLAIATSIDALAVGVSFAMLEVRILPSSLLIGVTTFVLSCIGVVIGNFFGSRYQAKAERVGGVILIVIGLRIILM